MKPYRFIVPAAGMLFTAICAHGADIAAEALRDSLPAVWELPQQYFQPCPTDDRWWENFGDSTLLVLLREAVENNFDVAAAQNRIKAAAQLCRQTQAGYYPTLAANAGYTYSQAAPAAHGEHSHPTRMGFFQVGLSMNWEIDVFGRIQAQLKADRAQYRASEADYDATLVSLCANVAKSYFQLRLAQTELDIAQSSATTAQELLKTAQTRYEVGLSPALDVLQARMTLGQTKAALPNLEAQVALAVNQLGVLLGQYPSSLEFLYTPAPLPEAQSPGVSGTPMSLLRRRPDLVAAEQQLAAAAAKVGIARKDFLPTLSLAATFGTEAEYAKDLFGGGSMYYSVAPTLSWTVFDGMARNARVAQAKYEMEAQIDSYNLTVMTAVQEVNNAMINWRALCDQLEYETILEHEARKQLELQVDRYKQGLVAFTDVANSQITVLNYRNSLASVKASQLVALVTLYSALGGGF